MENDSSFLFDVSAITLALAGTPVSDRALDYIRDAVKGRIDAVIPQTAMIGSYHILRKRYKFSRRDTEYLITNLLDSDNITWYPSVSQTHTRKGLKIARDESIDGWDGYYTKIAVEKGATILTMDKDFKELDGIDAKVILSSSEFNTLDNHLDEIS